MDVTSRANTVAPLIVAIGASAGGVEALAQVSEDLEPELPAAVFVVLHVPPQDSALPAILARHCGLPVSHAVDGDPIEAGRIAVAPPDRHLLVEPDRMRVVHGPRENLHRPSIDPLFRSAARHHGPRVIAVVLSGARDDGTAGLRAVARAGGARVVQQPDDALYASMPRSAIAGDSPEYVVPASEIGNLITRLAAEREMSDRKPVEMNIGTLEWASREASGRNASGFTCPECGGALWDAEDGRYVCRIGHGFAPESLLDGQAAAVENALSSAARALEEQAEMARRLAGRLTGTRSQQRLVAAAEEAERNADTIRELLLAAGSADG